MSGAGPCPAEAAPPRPHRRCSRGPPAPQRPVPLRAEIAGSGAGKGRERPRGRRCAPRPPPLPRALTVSDGDGHRGSGRRHLAPPQEPSAALAGRARSASLPQQENGNAALQGCAHGERLPAAAGTRPRQDRREQQLSFPIPNPAPPLANPVHVMLITCPPPPSAARIHRHKRHTKDLLIYVILCLHGIHKVSDNPSSFTRGLQVQSHKSLTTAVV